MPEIRSPAAPFGNRTFFISASTFSLIAALLLSLESYLTLQGKSLCSTAACTIVSRYLTISETLLITLGAGFFWLLTSLFFFARRYPRKIGYVPYLVLVIAGAVDGTLIGFQFFTIQQKCFLCIAVAATLLVIAILYCLAYKSYLLLFCCVFVWIGGFSTQSIMKMPAPMAAGEQMIFYKKASQADSPQIQNQILKTFIFSMECPHCLGIIATLAATDVRNESWQFASIDNDEASISKLSRFLKEAPNAENPFLLLKQVKEEPIHTYEISKVVKESSQHTLNFLANLGISSIPVLILDDPGGKKQIMIGATNILQALSPQQ